MIDNNEFTVDLQPYFDMEHRFNHKTATQQAYAQARHQGSCTLKDNPGSK
jgi:hypothetical protein